ncbi:MAG: M16 family metallopeptidase [Cyclobacteriaceae bacterium]
MKKLCSLLLILLLWVANAHADGVNIPFVEYDLDNGLHVILHKDNSLPLIAVNIMYHVGSKNEQPERTGFAHFFEHLMFEGSANIPRGEFDKFVEKGGGTLNAYTSNDVTNYYILFPSNQLETALWLESERMLHAKVDSIGIATQKSVVIEEKKQTQDNRPYGSIIYETMRRSFTKHPYQWVVIGDENHIREAEDHEFKAFHEMFYVPNNAVLVIAGDIDIEKTKGMVDRYFSDIPKGSKEIYRPNIVEPERKTEVRDTIYDNIQLPAVIQSYNIPARGTDDYYAVEMLGYLLSQGQSSRLHRSLVDEQQLALQVMAVPLGLEDPGVSLVFALPNMGIDPATLEDAMNVELEKVRNELISESELQKLKNQFESRIVNSNTTIASRATNLANNYTLFKDTNLINNQIEKYLAVTREDIQNAAKKYFRDDNRVVLYYLPKND